MDLSEEISPAVARLAGSGLAAAGVATLWVLFQYWTEFAQIIDGIASGTFVVFVAAIGIVAVFEGWRLALTSDAAPPVLSRGLLLAGVVFLVFGGVAGIVMSFAFEDSNYLSIASFGFGGAMAAFRIWQRRRNRVLSGDAA